MLKATAKAGNVIPPIPAGTYQAVCYGVVDLGTHKDPKFDKSSRKLLILWEIPELRLDTEKGDMPRVCRKKYTLSLSEKSNLRKDLESWRGKVFTPKELEGFDMSKLVNANCILQIVEADYQGTKYAKIATVSALMKNMKLVKPENPTIIFDLDNNPDLSVLPEWMQKEIGESEEAAHFAKEKVSSGDPYENQVDDQTSVEEEIPF